MPYRSPSPPRRRKSKGRILTVASSWPRLSRIRAFAGMTGKGAVIVVGLLLRHGPRDDRRHVARMLSVAWRKIRVACTAAGAVGDRCPAGLAGAQMKACRRILAEEG